MAFSPFEGGRGDETFLQLPGSFIPLTPFKANLVVFFAKPWFGAVQFPFLPPASGYVLFLLAQKKNQKKGAPSPYRSVENAFALWASTAWNTDRCVYPASQAVDPIRRSRSSNGNGVSHGLRAAEGNIRTSRCYQKYYKMSLQRGKVLRQPLRAMGLRNTTHTGKGFEIASTQIATAEVL